MNELDDAEKQRLANLWVERWSNASPNATHLPDLVPHRHARLRLHSSSESYVSSDDELREAISRWETLVDELLGSDHPLLAITIDWTYQTSRSPLSDLTDLQPVLPNYSYWRTIPFARGMECWLHLYLSRVQWRPGALTDLFLQAAGDCNDGVLVTNPELKWIIAPAWNRIDVYAPTNEERERFASRHADWLSPKYGQ